MRKRRALVGILLVLFLGALNVFLYAQPSIEELTGRIESLEKTIGELKKSSAEKDDIISFLKEQQSSVYQNANIALESVDKAIANLTVNVDRLSDLMTAVVLLIGVAFPIVTFFIQSKLDKKRIEGVEDKLVDVNEQAKALETRLSIKLEEAREQLSAEVNRAIGYSLEAKQWAAESKTSELLSKAHASKELDKKIELFTQIIGIDSENSAAFENRATA
ncbi:MAG: hypothetical protein GXX80_12660, partial [Thermotogaceae bacterium]|nr:hypothetical protein [Thermotogaceae bacterium]